MVAGLAQLHYQIRQLASRGSVALEGESVLGQQFSVQRTLHFWRRRGKAHTREFEGREFSNRLCSPWPKTTKQQRCRDAPERGT